MARFGRLHDTLSARLSLFVLLPTGVLLLAGGVATLVTLEQRFERQLQEEIAMVARSLQEPVSHAFERGRGGSLHSALSSALTIGRIHSANVFDERGELVATIGPSDASVDRAVVRRYAQSRQGGGTYAVAQGEPVYAYFVPVRLEAGSDRAGLLQVTRRRGDIDARMARMRRDGTVAFIGLMSLLGVLVALGYRRAIGNALADVQTSIGRIAAGDVEHRALVRGPLEVRRLVHELNRMLDALQEAESVALSERERRAQLQLRLAASERLAELGQLAGGIAHELGTPLAAASGRMQRALRVAELPDAAELEVERARRELERVEEIVRDVLRFGRTGTGRRQRVSLDTLVSRAAEACAREHAADIELTLEGDPIELAVDPPRLELAVTNLCRNAMQSEEVTRVSVRWWREGDEVAIEVMDDGRGVDPESRERLFLPFFTTRREGTGLGLAIVASVAREHGGRVGLEPSEQGARFVIRLRADEEVSDVG